MDDDTRRAKPRGKPDEPSGLRRVWLTTTAGVSILPMQPSSMSPLRPSGLSPFLNPTTITVQVLPPLEADQAPAVPATIPTTQDAPDLVIVVSRQQLDEHWKAEGVPSTVVHDLARQLGFKTRSDTALLFLKYDNRPQGRPTLPDVITIVGSLCLNSLRIYKNSNDRRHGYHGFHEHPELPASLLPKQTLKCSISRPLTLGSGPRKESVNATNLRDVSHINNRVTSTVQSTRNARRRRRRRAFRSVGMPSENEPDRQEHPRTEGSLRPEEQEPTSLPRQPLPQILAPSPLESLVLNSPTISSMSDSEDGLYVRPSIELVREALKLETAMNAKSASFIAKLNRVRLRFGTQRWNTLRLDYPLNITYEPMDFGTLRRQFLDQYDAWQLQVHPRGEVPAELLGQRRRRASVEDAPEEGPQPLPAALQDTATPPRRTTLQIPGSAWLSTQGARLSALIAGFPRPSPRTPTPVGGQVIPGEFPQSSTLGRQRGTVPSLPSLTLPYSEGFSPEVSLHLQERR
ncbi:hypothetical protein BJ508DRAFT_336919 [Ascobolus immersus RN42]|uniref:Uncharacterized protein n=1 Tax=Ascobolus immersus RN42 TaxID=1160509 RepID=A0A3N4H6W5_ASCIM|nr:hypothetical protein BJ508DRAFT_336919 [Ascobolus immersus RN42]